MSRANLGPHFGAAEFDCHNGQQWPPAAREALQYWCRMLGEPLRARFGPVRILSGFRPNAYNRSVGGAPSSYHRYELRYGPAAQGDAGVGVAADVVCASGDPAAWQQFLMTSAGMHALRSVGRGAAVLYQSSGFVHCDTGPARSWAG